MAGRAWLAGPGWALSTRPRLARLWLELELNQTVAELLIAPGARPSRRQLPGSPHHNTAPELTPTTQYSKWCDIMTSSSGSRVREARGHTQREKGPVWSFLSVKWCEVAEWAWPCSAQPGPAAAVRSPLTPALAACVKLWASSWAVSPVRGQSDKMGPAGETAHSWC